MSSKKPAQVEERDYLKEAEELFELLKLVPGPTPSNIRRRNYDWRLKDAPDMEIVLEEVYYA